MLLTAAGILGAIGGTIASFAILYVSVKVGGWWSLIAFPLIWLFYRAIQVGDSEIRFQEPPAVQYAIRKKDALDD